MGTRHLIAVIKDNEYRVAQYGQWDGYPGGQGINVLTFLRCMDRDLFEKHLKEVFFIEDEEVRAMWEECGADGSGFVTMDISNTFKQKYPSLHRDTGASILPLIQYSKEPLRLQNDATFAQDSLFCEWCYVIDLDKDTFEVYKGFNEYPLDKSERFFSDGGPKGEYYPVRHIISFDLDNLPNDHQFLSYFQDEDE